MTPLEPDCGERFAAQTPAAHRAREGTRQHFDVAGQGLEAPETRKEYARTLLRGRRQLCSADVAHHQGMTGHHEPGLVGPGPISDEQRYVLGGMSRRMQNLDGDVSKFEHVAVAYCLKRAGSSDLRGEHIARTGGGCQTPPRGHVIGMDMRVDDVEDAHTARLGGAQVRLDIPDGIHDSAAGPAAAAEEIRDRDRLSVQKRSQYHFDPRIRAADGTALNRFCFGCIPRSIHSIIR